MSSAGQDHEAKLFEGLAEAGMDSMAFSQAAGRPPGLADDCHLKIQAVASPTKVFNPWAVLMKGFASIFFSFLGSPSYVQSAPPWHRCLYLYSLCFSAFPQMWKNLLRRLHSSLSFGRLQALLRLLRSVLETGAETWREFTGKLRAQTREPVEVLERTQHPKLLGEVAPTLALAAQRAPQEFSKFFQEQHRDFALTVQSQAQWLQPSDLREMSNGQKNSLDATAGHGRVGLLHALVFCFYGISEPMGTLGEMIPADPEALGF
eukprot:Skav202679  [mRNA]  locus=scaffold1791:642587:646739:+ [translate_table: standard]